MLYEHYTWWAYGNYCEMKLTFGQFWQQYIMQQFMSLVTLSETLMYNGAI